MFGKYFSRVICTARLIRISAAVPLCAQLQKLQTAIMVQSAGIPACGEITITGDFLDRQTPRRHLRRISGVWGRDYVWERN